MDWSKGARAHSEGKLCLRLTQICPEGTAGPHGPHGGSNIGLQFLPAEGWKAP